MMLHANKSKKVNSWKKKGQDSKKSSDDWKKDSTCHTCKKKGHISPDCPQTKNKESNHYISGKLDAILEVHSLAFKEPGCKKNVSIFVDNGCSMNSVSKDLVEILNLQESVEDMMEVKLGYEQTVYRLRRMVEMSLEVPGFPTITSKFQVMPIPEEKDILLGMRWLREQNPDIGIAHH